MEWIVKIENKPEQRILVKFDPENESIIFIGQFRPKMKNNASVKSYEWIEFSKIIYSMDIDLDKIQKALFISYEMMNKRIIAFENINEGFNVIKLIEIKED